MGARTPKASAAERVAAHTERRSLRERFGGAAQPAAVPEARLADQPLADGDASGAPLRSRVAAGGDALYRQADHRRGRRCSRKTCRTRPTMLAEWFANGWLNRIAVAAGARIRAGGAVGRARPRRCRCSTRCSPSASATATSLRLMEHAADARSRGFRGQRAAGQPRARAPPGGGPDDADRPALRPGAGHRDDRQLRRGPVRLRAVADRAAGDRARAGVHRRSALQRAELLAQLRTHAGAARARLRAPDRRERRDGEGSEDLRPQRVPDRPLSGARDELLRGQPRARDAPRHVRQRARGARHHRLLRRLRVHRLAHAARRIHDRRPHVPRRLVPAPAQRCSKTC